MLTRCGGQFSVLFSFGFLVLFILSPLGSARVYLILQLQGQCCDPGWPGQSAELPGPQGLVQRWTCDLDGPIHAFSGTLARIPGRGTFRTSEMMDAEGHINNEVCCHQVGKHFLENEAHWEETESREGQCKREFWSYCSSFWIQSCLHVYSFMNQYIPSLSLSGLSWLKLFFVTYKWNFLFHPAVVLK